MYFEPSFSWTNYDAPRWAVKNYEYIKITERDFTQRYSLSVSNSKIDIWGFVPMITFSYTNKNSNIDSRGYEKWTTEFTMRQKF